MVLTHLFYSFSKKRTILINYCQKRMESETMSEDSLARIRAHFCLVYSYVIYFLLTGCFTNICGWPLKALLIHSCIQHISKFSQMARIVIALNISGMQISGVLKKTSHTRIIIHKVLAGIPHQGLCSLRCGNH